MPLSCSRCLGGIIAAFLFSSALAETPAPWGRAEPMAIDYEPQKVVYDVSAHSVEEFSRVLDRASFLNNIYEADPFRASIVLVLHGGEVPFFSVADYPKYQEIMIRAQSLTVGGAVRFRMCQVAARGHGLEPDDIHGFVEVVPMADAEIVRLQQEEGYVYMQ